MTEPSSLEPSIALAAYAEPLASNRRVLVFGSALASLSLQLLERGARSVHVCDADAVRVAEASARNRSTQISFSSLADSDLALRDGAFELALIDNLGAFDAVSVLRTAKRAIGPRGAAVVACPNPEASFPLLKGNNPTATALDYYALYDAVAAEFEHVRMLGQTPFVGYAIADFSASGEPEPALDTSFVPGGAEEPDAFIALASNQEVRLDEFAVIQLPTRRMLGSFGAPAENAPSKEKGKDAAEVARLNQWLKELEARASTADERADHAETELDELRSKLEFERQGLVTTKATHEREQSALRAETSALRTQSSNLRAEAGNLRTDAGNLRTDASTKDQELAKLKAALAERDQQLAERDQQLAERDQQLAERQQQLTDRQQQLTERQQQLAEREQQLTEREQQLTEQSSKAEQAGGTELSALESQLAERGTELRRLEQELRTAERTGRELVRELDRRRNDQTVSGNAELERALAEKEADLQAAAWTIESLSLRLELAGKSASDGLGSPESAPHGEEAR